MLVAAVVMGIKLKQVTVEKAGAVEAIEPLRLVEEQLVLVILMGEMMEVMVQIQVLMQMQLGTVVLIQAVVVVVELITHQLMALILVVQMAVQVS